MGFTLRQVEKNPLEGILSIPSPPNLEPGMKSDGSQSGSCCYADFELELV